MPHTMQRHEVSGPLNCLFEMNQALGLIALCATGVSYFKTATEPARGGVRAR
ncbi:hypothetical protein WME89_46300 [Sorangium sp. So ce321]|uniref:hypothetical protein n=1 Tax=Sorangium sp. So ce321 TaxID=3133300 RepID=UPI003F63864A